MVFEIKITISVKTDSINADSVVHSGQQITKTGERCDAVTQLLHIWTITGGRYFDVYRSFVGRWFLAGNRCVSVGTEVVVVLDRSDQNLTG